MNTKTTVSLLIGALALASHLFQFSHAAEIAAAPSTGSITGRVQNVATGQYLGLARVAIKGTDQVAFTDEFGSYVLSDVRSGPVVLEVFYTGLDAAAVSLELGPGATVERNVDLTSVARYGQNAAIVKLDPMLVLAGRETNAQTIATNEQRFAPNIKNVISTDALGPQMIGGAGEFLKTIPGVVVDYDTVDARAISLRGIGGGMTSFTTDGAQIVNTTTNAPSRTFQARSLTLNDISRIEITKVPLPSKPADSLGGSINFVRKSAFEKDGAELAFGLILVGVNHAVTLEKEPRVNYSTGKEVYRIRPGFEFTYTKPFGKNFGVVVSAQHGDKFNYQWASRNTWNSVGTGINTSVRNPFLQNYLYIDGDRHQVNDTISLKADWRLGRFSTLSFSGSYSHYVVGIGNQQFSVTSGTIGTPSVAGGTAMSFGPDFVSGATGRGSVTNTHVNPTQESDLSTGVLSYRFDNGTWRIEAGVNESYSYWDNVNSEHGHYQQANIGLAVPVRVTLGDIRSNGPRVIQAFDNNNREVNLYDINNYLITTTQRAFQHTTIDLRSANLDLQRRLNRSPFPLSIQVGGAYRDQISDHGLTTQIYNYNGADGNPATTADQGAAAFMIQGRYNGFGFHNLPFASASGLWDAAQKNPNLLTSTPAQIVATESARLTNSEYITEKVYSGYVQMEARMLRNRLKIVTGVRYEDTNGEGKGSAFDPDAVFVRNANGSFARNAQGARIRKAEAGAVGSMEELLLTRKERAARSNKGYDGYYPSLHLTYDVQDNFLVRAAYARTYGRPDFSSIVPRTEVREADLSAEQAADGSLARGTLIVRNPSLRPWTADNYDLSAEYYTDSGGMFSAGVFYKDIVNFFGTATRRATAADINAVGLDPQYVGWDLSTTFNSGDAQIKGVELSARQSLRGLTAWGQFFTVFANGTKLWLNGNPGANFSTFLPESANWGFSFNRQRVGFTARWNYRGLDKRTPVVGFGDDGYLYYTGRTVLDLSLTYQLTRRLSVVGTFNNATNEHIRWQRRGAETPVYAQQWQVHDYGALFTIGINGKY